MNDLVLSQADYDQIKSLYPHLAMEPLTTQEEQLLLYWLRGLSLPQAARAAGMSKARADDLLHSAKFEVIKEYLRRDMRQTVGVTRDMLNAMLFEAHAKSATATEEIAAVRELGNLNGLYPSKSGGSGGNAVSININNGSGTQQINTRKELEQMPEEDLQRLAGDVIDLDPDSYALVDGDADDGDADDGDADDADGGA